jgi:hypothetical protein
LKVRRLKDKLSKQSEISTRHRGVLARRKSKAKSLASGIVTTYRAPNKTLPELGDMVNRGAIEVLKTFSEAAREKFHRLEV